MVPNHSVTETLQTENRRLQQQVVALEQTVTELCQSRQMLQLVLDSLPLAIAWKNSTLVYQGCNRQFAQNAGLETPTDIVGKTDFDLHEPDRAEQQRTADHQVVVSGTPEYQREEPIDYGGIVPTWLRVSRIPLYDGSETPCAIVGITEDITDHKEEEVRLRIFEALIKNSPDAIGIASMDGILTYMNEAFLRQYGLQNISDRPVTFAEIHAPEEMARLPIIMQEVQTQGYWRSIAHYQRTNGERFPGHVTGFLIRYDDGTPRGVAGIIRDISEQVRQEQELRTFYALAENAPDGFAMSTLDGIMTYTNAALLTMLGYTDKLIGKSFFDFVALTERDNLPTIFDQVKKVGSWSGILLYERKDGSTFKAQVSTFLITDDDGRPLGAGGIIHDLTEQIRAEEERAALQEQIIIAQQATLRELSTPLIPLANNIVAMPLIGSIDSTRAQQILEALLQGVADHRAATVIIDITGVQVVDTQVANALVRAAQAVKLLGAQVILTGIRPEIAQTLVGLGADLTGITTQNTLQSGITFALKQLPGKTNRGNQVKTGMPLRRNPNRA